jgi:formylglycine-generating enzyme required for sulfatase activity
MRNITILVFLAAMNFALAFLAAEEPLSPTASRPGSQPATKPADIYAKWPFDAKEAVRRRNETAKALGIKEELSLDLGNDVKMKLVLIPAGKFMMGSPSELGYKDELQHEVIISRPFYMGVYAVTQEQYEQVIGKNPSSFKGAQNPVESVSWEDVVAFCKAVSRKTDKLVRLPTEAQWEYACRAGAKTNYWFGNSGLANYEWYGTSGNNNKKTHPVGQKKPNAWGMYDMTGNVMQWCQDWYGEDYYANSPKVDPQGPDEGHGHVLRGTCWGNSSPQTYRCSRRFWSTGGTRERGFRIVVLLDKEHP